MRLTIELKADGSGLTGTVRVAKAELDGLARSADNVAAAGRRGGSGLSAVDTAARRATGGLSGTESAARRTGAALTTVDRNGSNATRSVRELASGVSTLQGTLATLGIAFAAREFLGAGMAMDRFNTSLAGALGAQQASAREMGFLRAEADRLGIFLPNLIQGYTGLTAATRGTNLEGAKTRDIFLGVAEGARALNLTAENTAGVLTAVQQIAGKGVVSMEELRLQLGDRLPGAMQIAARSMNMPMAEFMKLVASGELLSEVFLPRFAEEMRRSSAAGLEFARNSPAADFERLKTAVFEFAAAGSSGPVLESLAGGARSLTEALKDATDSGAAQALGEGLALVIRQLDTLVVAVAAFYALKLGSYLLAQADQQLQWIATTRAATVAERERAQAAIASSQARAAEVQQTLRVIEAARAEQVAKLSLARAELESAQRTLAATQSMMALSSTLRARRDATEAVTAAQLRLNAVTNELAMLGRQQVALQGQLATAATAQVAAQGQLAAAVGRSGAAMQLLQRAGSGLFTLMGGWTGVAVAAAAAIYAGIEAADAANERYYANTRAVEELTQQLQRELELRTLIAEGKATEGDGGFGEALAKQADLIAEVNRNLEEQTGLLSGGAMVLETWIRGGGTLTNLLASWPALISNTSEELDRAQVAQAELLESMILAGKEVPPAYRAMAEEARKYGEAAATAAAFVARLSFAGPQRGDPAGAAEEALLTQLLPQTEALTEAQLKLVDAWDKRTEALGRSQVEMINEERRLLLQTAASEDQRRAINASADALIARTRAVESAQKAEQDHTRQLREAEQRYQRNQQSQRAFREELMRTEAALSGPVRAAQIEYELQLERLDTRMYEGEIALEDYYLALEQLEEGYRRASRAAVETEDVVGRLQRTYAEEIRLAGLSAEARNVEVQVLRTVAAERENLERMGPEERARRLAEIRETIAIGEAGIQAAELSVQAAERKRERWVGVIDEISQATAAFAVGEIRSWSDFGRELVNITKRWVAQIIAELAKIQLAKMFGSFGGSLGAAAQQILGSYGGSRGAGGYVTSGAGMVTGGGNGGFNLGSTGYGQAGNSVLSYIGNSSTAQQALTYAPYAAAAGGALYGLTNRGGSTGSGGSLAAGAAYGYAGYALGTVATGALLGASAGAATGVAGAAAGGALAGGAGAAAAIPVVGWIVAALALIDAFSGGKLFGTRYKPDEMTSSIGIENGEAFTQSSLTEVRNRSLFRGRQWRTTDLEATPEAIEAAQALFNAVDQTMTSAARQLRGSAPELLDVAIRTVQDFDSKGRATTSKLFVDVLGRSWEEATQELAANRITAESIIATIDQVLGTTVSGVAQSVGNAFAEGVESGIEGGGADRLGDQAAMMLKSTTAGVMGEASAIAERWRGDAEQLLAGAQFLLGVATDLRNGFDLLESGTLTPIVELVEDLARGGETLQQTYARIVVSTQSLEGAVALMGVELDLAREEFVRFSVDIADAAGGLERAQSLWNNFFARFFTPEERLEFQSTQTRGAAQREFDDIGLDLDSFTGAGGMEEFRRIFTQLLPTLSAEAVVQWLEAAEALGLVLDLDAQRTAGLRAQAEAAAAAEAQRVADLASLMEGFRAQAFDAAIELAEWDLSPLQRELAAIQRASQEAALAAIRLGATEEQLAEIRAGFATQALLAQRRAQQSLNDLLDGLVWEDQLAGMSEYEQQVARLNRQFDGYIAQAIALGASEEQLAQIRGLQANALARLTDASQRTAAAANGAADAVGRAGDQLNRIRDFATDLRASLAEVGDSLREWINQVTGYTPEVQGETATLEQVQAEIRRRYAQQEDVLNAQREALLREIAFQEEAAGGAGYITPTIRVLLGQLAAVDGALASLGQSIVDLEAYAAEAFAARLRAITDGLREWRDSLLLNQQLTTLTPRQQLDEAARRYAETLAAAQGGDAAALQALQGVAQQYLELARGAFGSDANYQTIFDQILADVGALIGDVVQSPQSIVQQSLAAIAEAEVWQAQLDVLRDIRDAVQPTAPLPVPPPVSTSAGPAPTTSTAAAAQAAAAQTTSAEVATSLAGMRSRLDELIKAQKEGAQSIESATRELADTLRRGIR